MVRPPYSGSNRARKDLERYNAEELMKLKPKRTSEVISTTGLTHLQLWLSSIWACHFRSHYKTAKVLQAPIPQHGWPPLLLSSLISKVHTTSQNQVRR